MSSCRAEIPRRFKSIDNPIWESPHETGAVPVENSSPNNCNFTPPEAPQQYADDDIRKAFQILDRVGYKRQQGTLSDEDLAERAWAVGVIKANGFDEDWANSPDTDGPQDPEIPPSEGHTGNIDNDTIARLAKLPPLEYDRRREQEAKQLGVRVTTLDAEVRKARGETVEDDPGQGQAFAIESPEPWPEAVDGAELLNSTAATYRCYVVLPEHADTALALWTVHSFAYDHGRCTPILALTSPQKRCGKTTLMSVLRLLVNRPLAASNISPACVFRSIDKWRPTLLIDEADSFLRDNEELRGIINSGHTRDMAHVIRAVGDDHDPRQFSTWCPKAIALIGRLPPTLNDRAIELPLSRKTPAETVSRFNGLDNTDIRRKCARWVLDHAGALREADPVLSPELHDRAADNWRPLLAIADLAGGAWPEAARKAAKVLSEGDDDIESHAVMLLADIRDLFEDRNTDRLFSEDIGEYLHALEDRPWPQWGRSQKPITKNQVARLLKQFKIKPTTMRDGGARAKGYTHEMFKDTFSRYLPRNSIRDTVTMASDMASGEIQTVTPEKNVTDEKSLKPAPDIGCHGVTDRKAGSEPWSIRI